MSSSSFEQGDIVIAQLLFSEQIGVKLRPALVLSNSEFNKKSDDLILLKITSGKKRTEYDLSLKAKDIEEGKLKKESQIMVDNPVTTYKGLILSKAGKVSEEKLKEVKAKTEKLYNL